MSEAADVVLKSVREGLAAELRLPVDEIGPESKLDNLPNADSVRLLRVVAKLENQYDVEFEDDDVRDASTVSDLVGLVVAARSAAGR